MHGPSQPYEHQYNCSNANYYAIVSRSLLFGSFLFFFQAEDGIRDLTVTGVQTCALPICFQKYFSGGIERPDRAEVAQRQSAEGDNEPCHVTSGVRHVITIPIIGGRAAEIGRASCRERG